MDQGRSSQNLPRCTLQRPLEGPVLESLIQSIWLGVRNLHFKQASGWSDAVFFKKAGLRFHWGDWFIFSAGKVEGLVCLYWIWHLTGALMIFSGNHPTNRGSEASPMHQAPKWQTMSTHSDPKGDFHYPHFTGEEAEAQRWTGPTQWHPSREWWGPWGAQSCILWHNE